MTRLVKSLLATATLFGSLAIIALAPKWMGLAMIIGAMMYGVFCFFYYEVWDD